MLPLPRRCPRRRRPRRRSSSDGRRQPLGRELSPPVLAPASLRTSLIRLWRWSLQQCRPLLPGHECERQGPPELVPVEDYHHPLALLGFPGECPAIPAPNPSAIAAHGTLVIQVVPPMVKRRDGC